MSLAILSFLTLGQANSHSALERLLTRLGIDLSYLENEAEAFSSSSSSEEDGGDEDPSWDYHDLPQGPDYVLDSTSGQATVYHEGASAIKVHVTLSGLEDCPVLLKVSSEDGSESYEYDGSDFNDANCDGVGDDDDCGSIFAMSISSDTAVVSWDGEFEGCGSDLEARIDGYLVEDSETRRSETESICGTKYDWIDRECAEKKFYKDFKNAKPVAKLVGAKTCTAWKLNGDYALTNAHCCPEYNPYAWPRMYHNSDPAINAGVNGQDFKCTMEKQGELWFRYERKKCGGSSMKSTHKVAVKKVLYYMKGVSGEDFALVELKHKSKTKKFNAVKFDINPDAFVVGRKMVITGHPNGWAKKLSLYEGEDKEPCKVTSISSDKKTFRYKCDTTGGNSGSPVLLADLPEPRAIGIHQQAGCNTSGGNRGTTALAIWPKIQPVLCPDNKDSCTELYLRKNDFYK